MRVVVDTNTLASGALGHDGSPPTAVVDAWREGLFTLVVSLDIMVELARTLAKPYFATRLDPEIVVAFLQLVTRASESVEIEGRIEGVATHAEDDRILEAAANGKATYLVTGDSKLQDLGEFEGVPIVSPRQFLDLVSRHRKGGGRA